MPRTGHSTRSIYNDEILFNDVHAGLVAYNDDPSDTRNQADIARSVGISSTSFGKFAEEYSNGNFPASYEAARAQGLGMSGGDPQLRLFAEDNIDTDDTGHGKKSQLFRNFVDRFPLKDTEARKAGVMSVRRIIKRLRRQREERAALAAEAANYDSSNDSSDDEGGFH